MAVNPPVNSIGQTSQLQLHDIHLPEQVSNLPVAPGWWILITTIIITAVFFYNKYKKTTHLNASKKQALLILASKDDISAKACLSLLKWAAIQYFSRQQLAKIYGDNLQDFLTKQLPEKQQEKFIQLIKPAFASQYQADNTKDDDVDKDCKEATKLWLNHALPVKNTQKKHTKVEQSS